MRVVSLFTTVLCLAIAGFAGVSADVLELLDHFGGSTIPVVAHGGRIYTAFGPRLAIVDPGAPQSTTPLGQTQPLPGWIAGVAVDGQYAYVAAADGGLRVVAVADAANPIEVGSFEFSGEATAVAVMGGFAYVTDSQAGLRVVDVSDPTNPTQVTLFETSGTPFHLEAKGDHVFVADGFFGLRVIDISDPANPTEVAFHETPGVARFVHIVGDLLYLADGHAGIRILDITDPTAPAGIGIYDSPGFGLGVAVSGDHAYVADGPEAVRVVDITDPTAPFEVGDSPTPSGLALTSTVTTTVDYLYVGEGDRGLRVLSLADPANPQDVVVFEGPAFAQGVAVSGAVAVVANDTGGTWTVDLAAQGGAKLLARLPTPVGPTLDVEIAGHYAYVADGFTPLRVIDIADPASPVEVAAVAEDGFWWALVLDGSRAYVGGDSGVLILDISDPTAPVRLGLYLSPASVVGVAVNGDTLLACAGDAGLRLVDVSDPSAPAEISTFSTPDSSALGVAVAGSLAYLAVPNEGIVVIDIADTQNPTELGHAPLAGELFDVAVSGDFAFVAGGSFGLRVVDVSDPAVPREVGTYVTSATAWRVSVEGTTAYVSDQGGGVFVLGFDETQIVPPAAGGSFGLGIVESMPNPVVLMNWLPGTAQSHLLLGRDAIDSGSRTYLPFPPGWLPPSVVEHVDMSPGPESTYCYELLSMNGGEILARSDYLCYRPGTRTGSVLAEDFTIRLHGSQYASLSWEASDDIDLFVLIAEPLDGSDVRISGTGGDEFKAEDNTMGIPTCYKLLTIRGFEMGTTDELCAYPKGTP